MKMGMHMAIFDLRFLLENGRTLALRLIRMGESEQRPDRTAGRPGPQRIGRQHGSGVSQKVECLVLCRCAADGDRPRSGVPIRNARAFSLIEIMVVMALLSVIVLGLMAMFNQTQRAFRLGMSQTDILESGRMATDQIARELRQITPTYFPWSNTNGNGVSLPTPNFDAVVTNYFAQPLPGSGALRTNVMSDIFFITRQNQTWTGIGYFVRSNLDGGDAVAPVGTLYRFETNDTVAQFDQNPGGMFAAYDLARNNGTNSGYRISKILDGVVSFRIRPSDPAGWVLPHNPMYSTNLPDTLTNLPAYVSSALIVDLNSVYGVFGSGEITRYLFYSNAVPAAVELEIGILEQHYYERYRSIPVYTAQTNFLSGLAGHEHLFRQRVVVRNVDLTAYQYQ